jgi:ABC-type bacteriocin/lantibiotic exporter with double-glycine peptidase domain
LYKKKWCPYFDEVTSALDNQTEQKIMQQIAQLKDNQTIFFIAHRFTTLKQCDSVISINTDYTIEKVSYNEIG